MRRMALSPKFFGTFKQVVSGPVSNKIIGEKALKFDELKEKN